MPVSTPTKKLDAAKLRAALAYRKIGVYEFAHVCDIGETTASYITSGARRAGRFAHRQILDGCARLGIPENEVVADES